MSPLLDPIATGFELVTLVPQPFWLLLILLPNWKVTRAGFEPIWPLAILGLVHFGIVVLSTQGAPDVTAPLDLFNKLFDVREDGLKTYLELGKGLPDDAEGSRAAAAAEAEAEAEA